MPSKLDRVATVVFLFPFFEDFQRWNQQVHVYISREWTGDIMESDEIDPRWFNISEVPYTSMYPDAHYWLPKVLDGRVLTGEFLYGEDWKIKDYRIVEGRSTVQ